MNGVELLGTIASVVVAVSLTMRNIRWLRWVNLVGSTLFSVYGLMIQAWPVFGLNAFIVVINTVYLVKLSSTKDRFALLELPKTWNRPGVTLLTHFIETYGPDMALFQPDYPRTIPPDSRVFFVLREAMPINLFVCQPDQGKYRILIDYAIPAWRDFHNARYLYERGLPGVHWDESPPTFVAQASVSSHARYLKKMGFVLGDRGDWIKELRNPPGLV